MSDIDLWHPDFLSVRFLGAATFIATDRLLPGFAAYRAEGDP